MSEIELSDEQLEVVEALSSGIDRGKMVQTLGGYAGTGKTTSIRALKERHPGMEVCAFTGKAANVLRRKGIDAATIHSLIYVPVTIDEIIEPAKGKPGTMGYVPAKTEQKLEFHLRDELDSSVDGFIVDEASMVGELIYRDLLTFGLPLVFVGDHGQLPPVQGDLNLMEEPQYRLEHVHRNAGDIARFAEWLRFGNPARNFERATDEVALLTPESLDNVLLMGADQVICAFNKTRVSFNRRIRKALGRGDEIEPNDRIMFLKNDRVVSVFNGLQGQVTSITVSKGKPVVSLVGDSRSFEDLPVYLVREKDQRENWPPKRHPVDFAYCITAHKAQGDEWDDVLVIEQKCEAWEHRRWAYTAASRARSRLSWVLSP